MGGMASSAENEQEESKWDRNKSQREGFFQDDSSLTQLKGVLQKRNLPGGVRLQFSLVFGLDRL